MNEESQELAEGEAEGATPSGGRGDAAAEDRASHLGFVAHENPQPPLHRALDRGAARQDGGRDRAGARGEKLAGMCLRSLQRVSNLVEDHLLSERLDTGSFQSARRACRSWTQVVSGGGAARRREQPIELELSPGPGVLADRALLGRRWTRCSMRRAQGASAVEVSGRASDGEVRLVIRGAEAGSPGPGGPAQGCGLRHAGKGARAPCSQARRRPDGRPARASRGRFGADAPRVARTRRRGVIDGLPMSEVSRPVR